MNFRALISLQGRFRDVPDAIIYAMHVIYLHGWNFSVQSMHKLNVAYNNAFRFMHHLPTYCSASLMFVVNRVPNCRAVIRNRIYGSMKRLVSSSNAIVLSAVTSDARFRT